MSLFLRRIWMIRIIATYWIMSPEYLVKCCLSNLCPTNFTRKFLYLLLYEIHSKTSPLYNQSNNHKSLKQNIIYQSLRDDQRTRLFLFSWSSGWFDLPIEIWQLPFLSSFLCKCCLVQYHFHIPPVQTFSQTWVGKHLNLQGVKKKP